MPEISIVVPVYNEEASLPLFLISIREALSLVTEDYEIIFAADPCTDHTEDIIAQEHAQDSRIKLLRFSRRFGQPAATWAGLAFSSGKAIIPIDCDMQDPPSLIPEMVRLWREGYKVVLPQRRSRVGENCIKKAVHTKRLRNNRRMWVTGSSIKPLRYLSRAIQATFVLWIAALLMNL